MEKSEQNLRSIAKGPLPAELVAQLEDSFGHLREPVGN